MAKAFRFGRSRAAPPANDFRRRAQARPAIVKCRGWETDPNAYLYFITQAPVWEKILRRDRRARLEDPSRLRQAAGPAVAVETKSSHASNQWTMTKTKFEAMGDPQQGRHPPAAPILSMKEIIEDQSLRANRHRGRSRPPPPAASTSRSAIRSSLSDSPSEVTRSPLLGEHTDEILRQVLGFSDPPGGRNPRFPARLDPPRKQAAE